MSEKVRLNLVLSNALNDKLETIAASSGTTKTDVIRQALALIDYAHKAKREHKHIGIVTDPSKLDVEFIGQF